MLEHSIQWRCSKIRIMELVPSAQGAAGAPGKIKKENKSYKPQAPSLTSFKL
jgi:hypothetical protein